MTGIFFGESHVLHTGINSEMCVLSLMKMKICLSSRLLGRSTIAIDPKLPQLP